MARTNSRNAGQAYTGDYWFSNIGYYIHQHYRQGGVLHLGAAQGGTILSDSALANEYAKKRANVAAAVKQQYRNLFQNSLNQQQPSDQALQLINSAMSDDNIMSQINKQLGEQMSNILNIDKMRQLMQLQINTTNPRYNSAIDFRKILQNEVPINEFNKLLTALNQACNLISGEQGRLLGQALTNVVNGQKGNVSRSRMGTKLQAALADYKKQLNGKIISSHERNQIEGILDKIEPFARNITSGKKGAKQKEDIAPDGIKKMIQDIFNTGFAEALSASLVDSVKGTIIDQLSNIKVIGAEKVQVALSDSFGNYTGKGNGDPQFGKADAIFENIKLSLQEQGSNEERQVRISIGISDKFYKGARFPGIPSSQRFTEKYSSGSGSYLTNILNAISTEKRWLYLAYNTIAHGYQYSEAQGALHDIIALRSVIYLFGARNTSDFAQFMFVNGQIVPLWDIIMAAIKTSLNVTESQIKKGINSDVPFAISLGDNRQSAQNDARTIDDQFDRVRKVNNYINKITISAHLDLSKFKALGGSVFSKF